NARGRRLGRKRRDDTACCKNGVHWPFHQFRSERGKSLVLKICPSIFDQQIFVFDITRFVQTAAEGSNGSRIGILRSARKKANYRGCLLLRRRKYRPSNSAETK